MSHPENRLVWGGRTMVLPAEERGVFGLGYGELVWVLRRFESLDGFTPAGTGPKSGISISMRAMPSQLDWSQVAASEVTWKYRCVSVSGLDLFGVVQGALDGTEHRACRRIQRYFQVTPLVREGGEGRRDEAAAPHEVRG